MIDVRSDRCRRIQLPPIPCQGLSDGEPLYFPDVEVSSVCLRVSSGGTLAAVQALSCFGLEECKTFAYSQFGCFQRTHSSRMAGRAPTPMCSHSAGTPRQAAQRVRRAAPGRAPCAPGRVASAFPPARPAPRGPSLPSSRCLEGSAVGKAP